MFTGLIEEIGVVSRSEATERGLRLSIDASVIAGDLKIGDSIAVDGVCQTVVSCDGRSFSVEAMAPTLARTTLGSLRRGARVNLERALALGARMGGHLVQGHVDAVATVERVEHVGEHLLIDIEIPEELAELAIPHGSIAINGVSLTVNEISPGNTVQVAIIPHTQQYTNLCELVAGSEVNVEGDMIGKFVVEYMKRRGANAI